jgi:hypothetical protein
MPAWIARATGSGALLAFSCSALLFGAQSGALGVSSIVERSVSANEADWGAQPQYSYRVHNLKGKSGQDGRLKVDSSKTYEVVMIDGSPYQKLIAIDNQPLSRDQQAQEVEKLKKETAARHSQSQAEREQRVSKYRASRAEEHLLMQQMVQAFNYRLVGEESVGGTECYVLQADPNPNYQPPVEKARVLTGMRGRLWIDKNQYHWVKVEAQVVRPVQFGYFVAQVKPGTRFELEQAAFGTVWLPKRFSQSVNATVFGLYGMRNHEECDYSDYVLPSVADRRQSSASDLSASISDSGRGGSPLR